jgi:SAM-dependent methyltransferase
VGAVAGPGVSPPAAGDSKAKAADAAGEATLELFRKNDGYTEFLWERLASLAPRPVAGRVLEVGCGIGNLTRIILRAPGVTFLKGIDMEPAYVERIRREIPDDRLDAAVARAEEFCPGEHREGGLPFDFIVASNVLEHIEDHARVLASFRSMLAAGGTVLLLVPAHPFLHSSLDRSLSHFRRYSRKGLTAVARECGLTVRRLRHFNPLGALGWWLNGKVLRRSLLPEGQLSLYARFAIPVSRLIDRLNPLPIGVSLIGAFGRED